MVANQDWRFVWFLAIFDNWLTEIEAEKSQIMFYSLAKKHHVLQTYLVGENNFIQSFQNLDDIAIDLNQADFPEYPTNSPRFLKILKNGLREKAHFDLYFPKLKLKAQSNFDRTVILFSKDLQTVNFIEKLVSENQLFIIKTTPHSNLEKD